jgi:hypothetical protein
MLIFAEGTVNEPLSDVERAVVRARLGPMVDEGFIQSGYINMARGSWFLVPTSRPPYSGSVTYLWSGTGPSRPSRSVRCAFAERVHL